MKTIGQRIQQRRKSLGITRQSELGKLVGLDQSTISDIENGAGFGAQVLMQLCDALDTTAEYLMQGQEATSDGEAEILTLYRKMSDAGRLAMVGAARGLVANFPRAEKAPNVQPTSRVSPEGEGLHADTVITNTEKHLELSVPNSGKRRASKRDKHRADTEPKPSERSEHTAGSAQTGRTGRT